MEHSFWEDAWNEGKTGFHQAEANRHLIEHLPRLIGNHTSAHIFVPLCGKSIDMTYLAGQGHRVVGVEVVEQAARSYFDELGLSPSRKQRQGMTALQCDAPPIAIIVGDVLSLSRATVPEVDCIYDRAALIALPEAMRISYSQKLVELASENTTMLLLTLSYDQAEADGPPFSVPPDEVYRLFRDTCDIDCIRQGPTPRVSERLQSLGVQEAVWLLTFKG